ncbi:FAD/NAD-binding domain-containing protein [Fomitiporia mediterranea MF3/22]|uniref:FAD/NAD-binding domain-containing protein n=1 Tax=Fomitiporia mediterranea (strain MF3/22) TaxID=694068 RepID=UPI00044097F9|nr:FAD/NAD-binding domain-containing protein [Fomitiporia mediterranea MF3/22]EJD04876.1 FAD/NAD-binding domain-containing protein [Fomitiporia mediterranea MF3/22]
MASLSEVHRRCRLLFLALFALSSATTFVAAFEQKVFGVGEDTLTLTNRDKSIAIVGAGSAGLAALKALLELPQEVRQNWEIVLFEERRNVSGIWLPDLNDPHPPKLPETPLYPSLRTNTPHPTMTYPHFPFPPMTPVFPTHEYVSQYHYDFAKHYGLIQYIRFNTSVVRTEWIGNSTTGKWNITSRHQNADLEQHGLFDHLIAANGHYHYPRIPTWPGQDDWLTANKSREILHSMYWRNGTKYAGRNVLVVGGGASARDVVLYTASHCHKIFLSLRSGNPPNRLNERYILKPGISHFTADGVVFMDGTVANDVDAVVLGTGYELRAPFLTAGDALLISPSANESYPHPTHITTNLRYIYPLHEHIFSLASSYPPTALSFVGLNALVANCPTDFAQAMLVAHAIANPGILPSRHEMLNSLRKREAHYYERGYDPYRVGHRLEDVDGFGNASYVYEEGLLNFLKDRGAVPDDGRPYVEQWRRLRFEEFQTLWRAWKRVEDRGSLAIEQWLDGIRTENEWGDLMQRLIRWEKNHENSWID